MGNKEHTPIRLSRSKILLFSSAMIALSLLVAVTVLEIFLRKQATLEFPFSGVIYPYVMFRSKENYVLFDDKPSLSSRTGERTRFFTNEDGFRTPSPDYRLEKVKPPSQLRIAVTGGSTVVMGTTYETTLAGAIKRALQAQFPVRDIEVINGGIISANARQEFIYFILTIVDYEPDILIVFDGVNDTGVMLRYEYRPNFPYNWEVMEAAWEQYQKGFKDPVWKLILSRSAIVQRLWPQFTLQHPLTKILDPRVIIKDPARRKKYVDAYLENWEKIFRACKGYDVHPVFVLQPTALVVDNRYDNCKEAVARGDRISYPELVDCAHRSVYEDTRVAVAEFAKKHPDATVSDMSAFLPTESFYDGCHVYDDMNDMIAQEIVKLITPKIKSR